MGLQRGWGAGFLTSRPGAVARGDPRHPAAGAQEPSCGARPAHDRPRRPRFPWTAGVC